MNDILDLQTLALDDQPSDASVLTIGEPSGVSLLLCGGLLPGD